MDVSIPVMHKYCIFSTIKCHWKGDWANLREIEFEAYTKDKFLAQLSAKEFYCTTLSFNYFLASTAESIPTEWGGEI